jgi:Cu+-exporting ATPase
LKNLDIIEPLSKLDTLIFDKTGTLTDGMQTVIEESIKEPKLSKKILFALERKSTHPIAKSIVCFLEKSNNFLSDEASFRVVEINEIQGFGVLGIVQHNQTEYTICVGNLNFILKYSKSPGLVIANFDKIKKQSGTYIHCNIDSEYMGYLLLNDTPRFGIIEEISKLKSIVSDIQLLSGDESKNVERIANEVGIENFKGELKPDEKLEFLTSLQNKGKIVAMVGDGINDAGILAKANVGISLELASDISIDKADIILMKNDLTRVRIAIEYAKLTSRTIKQNIGISLLYNAIMLPLAAFGLMEPIYCALFMTLSSLTVIANAFLLRLYARKI